MSRTMWRRVVAAFGYTLAVGVLLPGMQVNGQSRPPLTEDERRYRPGRPDLAGAEMETLPVQGRVSVIVGGTGANIVVLAGDQGALLVDAGTTESVDRVLAEVRALTSAPIKGIVNTAMLPDHIGGNERLARAGQPMFLGSVGATTTPQAPVFAHERALGQISAPTGQTSAVPSGGWPTETFVGPKKKIFFNHEPIEFRLTPGRTDGDVIVWFRGSDVIAAGEVFSTVRYPQFDATRGGSMQGVLDGLNQLIDIAVPEFNQQGGTRIVPSRGRIANQSDVVEYRDMATIVRDRVRLAIEAGRTLEQVKAAGLTLEYDGLYATPAYSGVAFVEAIYSDLRRSR